MQLLNHFVSCVLCSTSYCNSSRRGLERDWLAGLPELWSHRDTNTCAHLEKSKRTDYLKNKKTVNLWILLLQVGNVWADMFSCIRFYSTNTKPIWKRGRMCLCVQYGSSYVKGCPLLWITQHRNNSTTNKGGIRAGSTLSSVSSAITFFRFRTKGDRLSPSR